MSDWENIPKSIEDYFGFIYKITNLKNNREYIGQKIFWEIHRKKALKGRSKKEKIERAKLKGNRRKVRKESSWRDYWGSCRELLEDIEKEGKEYFRREIIILCKTKFEMSYYEAKMQFEQNVLFDKKYYNGIINCRLSRKK